jgi:hypothetical protein
VVGEQVVTATLRGTTIKTSCTARISAAATKRK